LFALACNPGNFPRRLLQPRPVRTWTLMTLRESGRYLALTETSVCADISIVAGAAMLRKFAEAVGLWRTNFLLIAPIVLTVWLPGNLLGEYLI
jgi:hypothetical protein